MDQKIWVFLEERTIKWSKDFKGKEEAIPSFSFNNLKFRIKDEYEKFEMKNLGYNSKDLEMVDAMDTDNSSSRSSVMTD